MSLVCWTFGVLALQAQTESQTFYVATYGDDSWSGLYVDPLPDLSDGPFQTVHSALEAGKEALSKGADSVSVEVRTGRYILDKSIILGADFSGSGDFPFILTGHKRERAVLDLPVGEPAVIDIRSASNIVLSSLVIAGKAQAGIVIDQSEDISIQRIDLGGYDSAIEIDDSEAIAIAGCRLLASASNSTLLDSMEEPSRASNNILVAADLAKEKNGNSPLLLAQNSLNQSHVSAIEHAQSPIDDGLAAHYAFGPDNWRVDRVAGQNLSVRGEPGSSAQGIDGKGVLLKINSIQYAPISWNGFDLPRTVNLWYWNGEGVVRNTYLITTDDGADWSGFVFQVHQGELSLVFEESKRIWPAPDFRGKPTMLTLVVPHRAARLSEVNLYVDGKRVSGKLEGADREFKTSMNPPYLASTSTRLNTAGQKHIFDELSFWNRALSSTEVAYLYNNGDGIGLFPPPRKQRGDIHFPRKWDWPWQTDTTKHRDDLYEVWRSLKNLDLGKGVPVLENRRFQGEPGRRVFVDTTVGNDFWGSGSRTKPFKTIRRAVESLPLDGAKRLKQSTVIEIAPGIYQLDNQLNIQSWGSSQNWLAIRGSGSDSFRPVITYSNKAVDRVIRDRDSGGRGGMHELIKIQGQYIELSGLVFDQRRDELPEGDQLHQGALRFFSYAGEPGSNGIGCRILDVEVRNFLHAAVKGDAKGLIIDGVYFHDGGNTWHDHAIYISAEGEGSAFEVRRSLLLNSTGAAINQHKSSDGRDLPAPQGAIITHNVIMGNAKFGITTAGMGGSIAHNAIGYSNWYGIHFYRSSASLTKIQNNIFYGYPDSDLRTIPWTSYLLAVAKTKDPVGVVVEGNYFESGPASERRVDPGTPRAWSAGTTYYTSNTVQRNGVFYICEVIDNSKAVSKTGPEGTNPTRPTLDGDNIRWWFLSDLPNRVENNTLNGTDEGGRNFVDGPLGDFRLRRNGQAVGVGIDLGYANGRNTGPWPVPVP